MDDVTIQDGNQSERTEVTPGLTLEQFESFHKEVKAQPPWRTAADKEADYLDGQQLDSDILRKQQAIGLPPAIEPLMGPALGYVCGMEAKLRRDWRVKPNSDKSDDDDVAEALNVKLNEAERHSKADKACSNAFRTQAGLGVGWVEVSRDNDPFQVPVPCGRHSSQRDLVRLERQPRPSDARPPLPNPSPLDRQGAGEVAVPRQG